PSLQVPGDGVRVGAAEEISPLFGLVRPELNVVEDLEEVVRRRGRVDFGDDRLAVMQVIRTHRRRGQGVQHFLAVAVEDVGIDARQKIGPGRIAKGIAFRKAPSTRDNLRYRDSTLLGKSHAGRFGTRLGMRIARHRWALRQQRARIEPGLLGKAKRGGEQPEVNQEKRQLSARKREWHKRSVVKLRRISQTPVVECFNSGSWPLSLWKLSTRALPGFNPGEALGDRFGVRSRQNSSPQARGHVAVSNQSHGVIMTTGGTKEAIAQRLQRRRLSGQKQPTVPDAIFFSQGAKRLGRIMLGISADGVDEDVAAQAFAQDGLNTHQSFDVRPGFAVLNRHAVDKHELTEQQVVIKQGPAEPVALNNYIRNVPGEGSPQRAGTIGRRRHSSTQVVALARP